MLRVLLLLSGAFALSACGDDPPPKRPKPKKSKKAPPSAPVKAAKPAPTFEMAELAISHEDFKAKLKAPKGAIFKEEFGTLNVKLADGKQFWLQMEIGAPDLKAKKVEAEKNTVQKLVKVHTDTADTLVYETTAFGRTSFWLDTTVRVGARTVHCYSGRGGHSYGKGHIEAFEAACKSLKLDR
jgi:hypothetical protein